jgi:hypothetical protein
MESESPIEAGKKWLVECGYTESEAHHLLRALHHEDAETLWALAPKWIEHVGEHKKYQVGLLDLVAQGLFSVTTGKNGEWLFELNDCGLEAARQMGLRR